MDSDVPSSSRRLLAAAVLACAAAAGAVERPRREQLERRGSGLRDVPSSSAWLDTQGDGTAGSIYYKLRFTNPLRDMRARRTATPTSTR